MGRRLTESVPGRDSIVERQILAAIGGSREELGRLLEGCRQYLLLVAGEELPVGLRPKVGASDLVQETFIEAQRHIERFQGRSETDLLAWLRRILLHNVQDAIRRFRRAGKRRIDRELRFPKPGSAGEPTTLAAHAPSPVAQPDESSDLLDRAFDRLSDDHRRVIELRNLELKSFDEIGRVMGRTPDAARKLWRRAIEALQRQMGVGDGR